MNRADILDTAKGYVTRDRAATHGKAEDQFATIGQLWGALNGREYSPAQVALMMAALKLARAWGNPAHADNWIDLAGYAACGGEIATSTKTPREGLPFDTVKAERDAERAQALADMAETDAPLEWPACECAPDAIGCTCHAALADDYRQVTPEEIAAYIAPMTRQEAKSLADKVTAAASARITHAAPASAPPDGLGDVSATHVAESAEGHSEARVCSGCRFAEEIGQARIVNCANLGSWNWKRNTCPDWQPRSDLASIARREATSWQGQDGGVE